MSKGTPEFSRRVPVRALPADGKAFRFEATEAERRAIAARLGLPGIDRLEASFTMIPQGNGARARGRFEATIVQHCVVTLEPVTNRVEGEINQVYTAETGKPADAELVFDALAEEPPEPLIGGAAELGELVVEHLALALDPYPRVPGAQADLPREGAGVPETPFAKLRGAKFSATKK
jgi:hypothetical protein